jgi:hypothetical protein
MDYSGLGILLGQLSASDNLQRSAAEDQLEEKWLSTAESASFFLLGLVHHLNAAVAPELQMRSFAAILLRRLALQNPRYGPEGGEGTHLDSLSPDQTKFMQQQLLTSLVQESLNPVRNKIADTIAHLASHWVSQEGNLMPLC